jgi:hypothetical protein
MPDLQALQDELALRAQAQGPAWKQAARSGLNGGIDFLKGLAGVGDQGPAGPTATNAGQVLGAALPLGIIPESLVGSLMRMPKTNAPEATAKLLDLLNNVKGASGNALGQMATDRLAQETIGGKLPQYLRSDTMYRNLVNRVPEAADSLQQGNGMIHLSRPPGFAAQVNNERRMRMAFAPTPDEQLQKLMIDRSSRPSVNGSEDLQTAALSGLGGQTQPPPPLLGSAVGGANAKNRANTLARSGLTENAIRQIRAMGLDEAAQKFPNVGQNTLNGIKRGDTFAWVK